MNKLAITMFALSGLLLAGCGGDSGDGVAGNAAESPSDTSRRAESQPQPRSQRAETTTVAADMAAGSKESRNVASSAYTGFDMAGIYLGMSPEEAESIIREYAPDLNFKKDLISFNYNALGARYKTDAFVTYMGGSTFGGKLSLEVRLSYPPEPLKVVGISRGDRHEDSPIPQSVYVESLIEKYGPPASDTGTVGVGQNAERTLDWPFGNGTVECFSGGRVTATPPILNGMVQDGRRHPDPTPEFTQQCVSKLRYVLRGEPVIRASGTMLDVAATAEAEFANRAWIQSLVDEKSAPGMDRPQL